jgi:hypothetical protein
VNCERTRRAEDCPPYLNAELPTAIYLPQPGVSTPLLSLSSVAPSLTIRWPFVVFVLTLDGSLPEIKRKHSVCVSDRAGHWRAIGAIGNIQLGGNELIGQDQAGIGFWPGNERNAGEARKLLIVPRQNAGDKI